jgi:hypothetical protein
VFIRGDFVPGLSDLDSQEQILAYALVFGYAQQLLTKMIDQRAQHVLDSVPSKDAESVPAQEPQLLWEVEEPAAVDDQQSADPIAVPETRRSPDKSQLRKVHANARAAATANGRRGSA